MGKYTIEVRHICEAEAGLTEIGGYSAVADIISKAIPKIFNFDFPIYDDSYRNVLCTKILKHYYMREIGAETVGQWKLWLDARLNEIMPYYNQLYKSAMIEFNPMYDVDLTTTHMGKNGGSTTVESGGSDKTEYGRITTDKDYAEVSTVGDTDETGVNENVADSNEVTTSTTTLGKKQTVTRAKKDAFSDTPQGTLENVEQNAYLTNYRKISDEDVVQDEGGDQADTVKELGASSTDSSNKKSHVEGKDTTDRTLTRTNEGEDTVTRTNTETTTINTTDDYTKTVIGKIGGVSYSKKLLEFRSTFINIDKMIIDDLSDLFLGLW